MHLLVSSLCLFVSSCKVFVWGMAINWYEYGPSVAYSFRENKTTKFSCEGSGGISAKCCTIKSFLLGNFRC